MSRDSYGVLLSRSRAGLMYCLVALAFLVSAKAFAQTGKPSATGPGKAVSRQLQDLAGWNAYGLGTRILSEVSVAANTFSGTLQYENPALPKPTVVGFKADNQRPFNIAFFYPKLNLTAFWPSLRGTALDEIALDNVIVFIVPLANSGATIQLPTVIGSLPKGTNVTLTAGVKVMSGVSLTGGAAAFVSGLGSKIIGLRLTGSVDARMLSGLMSRDSTLQTAIINGLDLHIPLGRVTPPWKPVYLALGESELAIKGVSGKIAWEISTSLSVNVGSGLNFGQVAIIRDPVKKTVSIQSAEIKPTGNWLSVPVAGASINSLAFDALVDEQASTKNRFTLAGKYTVGGVSPKSFTVTLSGGSPARYDVALDIKMTVGQMLGWSVPGLDSLEVKDFAAGTGYTSGTVSLQGLNFTVVTFKGERQSKANAAFILDGTLKLPSLLSILNGTPLADVQLAKPGFVLAPAENAATGVKLPAPVAAHLGVSTLDLKAGLNVSANLQALGQVASLLNKVGHGRSTSLPLKGMMDPGLLTGAGAVGGRLAQAFLDMLDLKIPLGPINLPGVEKQVTASNVFLAFKGVGNGIEMSVAATLNIQAGGGKPLAVDSKMTLTRAAGSDTLAISGALPDVWRQPLGITWLNVRNVNLSASFGATSSFTLSGVTDLGKVKNLTVKLELAGKGGTVTDAELELTGADIPLSDIPGIGQIPNIKGVRFRDLVLSNRAIGGTLKSDLALLHDVTAFVFQGGGGWNLAALFQDVPLTKFLPLPSFAKPLLGGLKMNKVALVLSETGVNGFVSDLPMAVQQELMKIYGTPKGRVRLDKGVNLVSAIDLSTMGKGVSSLLGQQKTLPLQGAIGGIFGGAPSLSLAADIPPITLPAALKFAALPQSPQTSFFITLQGVKVATGVAIDTVIDVKMKKETVAFDSTLAFELDTTGGFTIDLQGKTLSPWANALGINGFTLDAGTRLEVSVSATSEVTLTFVGKSHIGKREVDLTGSASVLVAEGVIDKGAFEGKVSEIGLEDLVALANGVAAATGGKPIQSNFPVARLTNADVAFASPGVSIPEMNLDGGGIRLAGDLWLILKSQPLGKTLVQISESGLILFGEMADFSIGPVEFTKNKLDAKATISPPAPPYFKIQGGVKLFSKPQDAEMAINLTNMELAANLDLGELMKFDFRAGAGTPQGGLSPQELAKADMSLNARLTSDLPGWLRSGGKKPIEQVINGINKGLNQFVSQVDAAQKKVDGLNKQIAEEKERARRSQQSGEKGLEAARKRVSDLQSQISSLDGQISDAKGHIHKCDYKKTVRILGRRVSVDDLGKDAACAKDNISYGAKVTGLQAQRDAVSVAKKAADATLASLGQGLKDTDLSQIDPTVVTLEGELTVATGALEEAKHLAQGVETADKLFTAALDKFTEENLFVLKDSLIEGSLRKAIAGDPVVMGLHFEVAGTDQRMGFALSFTKPAFTTDQLSALALFVFSKAVEAAAKGDDNVPPGLAQLLHDAYVSKANAVAAEVDKALKANGLE